MSSIRRAAGHRALAKIAALMAMVASAVVTIAVPAQAASASPAATPPISVQAITNCTAYLPGGKCRTNAIQADPVSHCVTAALSGVGWGNIFDTNGTLGTHVGPTNFVGGATVCGLYGWYYLEVRNILGPATLGVLMSDR